MRESEINGNALCPKEGPEGIYDPDKREETFYSCVNICAMKDILSEQNMRGLWKGWIFKGPSTLVDTS